MRARSCAQGERAPVLKFVNTQHATIGAGDAFNGGFAFALSQNKSINEALKFANVVGGLSTTKQGAGTAMPTLSEVQKLLY